MTIGERIKTARKQSGMTQQELAEKLEISYVGVSQWESGRRTPKRSTLERIAVALDVPLSYLTDSGMITGQEVTDFIAWLWSRANLRATMLEHTDSDPEESERWERICNDLHKINEDYATKINAEREKLPEREEELLEIFRQLDYNGQRKILAIVNDYAKIPEYQRPNGN